MPLSSEQLGWPRKNSTMLVADSLPCYPEELAWHRKTIINFAVATTNVGHTPVIPPQGYLDTENQMWSSVFKRVRGIAQEHACPEYITALTDGCAYSTQAIPD